MILIDVEPLYKQYCELEKQARECQMDYLDHLKADSPNVIKWSAILTERTAYKYDLQDAPRVDAVPVVRCKDCVNVYAEESRLYCNKIYEVAEGDLYGVSLPVTPDDYCSKGERRNDNETNTD